MVEWIIGLAVVAAAAYFVYKVAKGSSVEVSTLDVNKDGKLDKADAAAAVEQVTEKVAEKAKENVAKVTDKAAAKVKKNVNKAVDKTAEKVVKKAGRPKKTA